jgi:DNA polymerase delta subunit 1
MREMIFFFISTLVGKAHMLLLLPLFCKRLDIECAGRKGIFPDPDHDPVIQIASIVTLQGEKKPFVRNVFVLGSCSNIVGSHVLSFDREDDLLTAWSDFLRLVDPDMIIGYNIANFDFPYLINRAKKLKATKFPYLGRLESKPFSSAQIFLSLIVTER